MGNILKIIIYTILNIPFYCLMAASPETDSPVTGYLDITVESNVNKVLFSYLISERNITDVNGRITNIVVPVKDFKCVNKIAFRDFLTLLKAEKFPELTIEIPAKVLKELTSKNEIVLKNVAINIAGVAKEYDIICTSENSFDGEKMLTGILRIDLNDLDIVPPVKYFGVVKIKDEVIVKFGLGIKDQNFVRK